MKNNSMMRVQVNTAFIILMGIFFSMQLSAQNSAANAQPVSKTTSVSNTNNSSSSKLAPWETQKIQPAKNKVSEKTLPQAPSAAQPIKGK